ncbi:T9SS type A sorting domain-containing protein [Segatella copri]|uniref:T9SS type A sorting domain-containing protein n=1 Tax=Segatella copri TaxID=165179 RepID=UPI002231004A|nr:T9SS type A sorting domain-containing protein [Segatella copri]MCW4084287.1 T9SS type A sorting domain-containing protein [Segatella copri]
MIFFNSTVIANEADRTVTFDFSKLPEGAKVENYVLKCTWANNDDDAKVVTYKGNTYILQEPSLNGEYSFKFVKQETLDALPLELSADNGAAVSSHDVDAIYKGGKLEVSLKDIVPDILTDFGVADKKNVSDFYMRWVLADKDDKIISGAYSNNGALALRKTSAGVGYYTLLSTDGSSLLPNGLDVTFELPSGSWSSDMKVYCLLSNDLTGYKAQYGVITKEPSAFKSKINVKLYSPDKLPFKHYEGIANKKGDWDMVNGHAYQKTHEWEYYYYVDGKEYDKQILLSLPFQRYEGDGNDLEPRGYFRWYNYNTDQGSEHLKVVDETQTKLLKKENWGLFANNIGAHPTSKLIGVNYSTSHVDDSWKGETIACDVSRYIDGMDESKTYLLHEPTLSIRYIFHILPKKKIADDIMAALCNHDDGDYTYEDNKKVTFGYKDEKSVTTLRLQLNDISRYSFYPMKPASLIKVVYNNDITEADFDKSKYVSVSKYGGFIEWRIYDVSKSKYCKLSGKVRFLDLSEEKLNDADWYNLEGSKIAANEKPVIDKGTPVFVVAYLGEGNDMCPVANFDVRFMGFHPMTHEQITAKGYNNRTISYLDEHYQQATKPISFDDDDDEQTVAAPTTPDDNQDRLPSRWDRRAYSFVYRDLIDYDATGYSVGIGHSPLHGDYGLYKTANISGISGKSSDGKDDYVWWTGQPLYDRTYEMTNGSQYGHFLYVDASDESRQIAAADFKANLCTGMQMIFSANVADMTSEGKQVPQVMFKLYGVNYDAEGNIQSQKLLHSFSSGDFKTNVDDLTKAKWYQVYGKIVIQKESGVENYSDFRVVIDNYCQNTEGADYAVDDIRIYIEPAKVEVLQEKPVCGGATTGTVKLKIRAIHETLNAILDHKDTKIYFRLVDEDGKPVSGEGLYSYNLYDITKKTTTKVDGDKYGTVDVYDSEETCKNFEIDGTNMIEVDSEGETYIVFSNKDYPLTTGKKYYVSVSTGNPAEGKANWGSPAEICSLYSDWFEMVSQHPIITDTDGNIVTDYKIPCDQADNYEVKIKGQLTTTDPHNGGKITLNNVKFIWYLDGTAEKNKLNEAASNEITISNDKLPLGKTHQIYMKPEGEETDGYIPYVINGTTFLLCTGAIPVDLRVMLDGPKLNFGFNDVDYPFNDGSYEASLRIGLPQLEKLKSSKGYLKVPLHSATMRGGTAITEPLTFIDDNGTSADASTKVYVATTNDPLWEKKLNTQVATLEKEELPAFNKKTQTTLNLKFEDDAVANFHEGYYYVLRFAYEKRAATAGTTNCPGESYLKLKIVPEFITWTPTADGGMNANWNNDANWHRSSSTELYDDKYTDYLAYGSSMSGTPTSAKDIPTLNSYVPMKFTKVTIGNLNGLPFPDLGNVVYRSANQIATKLTNGKGNEATKYIQYDIMAFWNEADANKGLEAGNLKCEKFYGNTCHQIYFKPQGELRDQCYLVYDKAWVEKELEPNKWYTMASPLQYIYAGDMYVPAKDGRQETKAFTDITFDTNVYSRSKYPVYQRAWMKSDVKEITAKGNYPASHYPSVAAPENVDMNLGYWSHVYNRVDESYAADGTFGGFSIKAGNALLPKDKTKKALLRLPKTDTEYQYFDYDGSTTSGGKSVTVGKNKGHGKFLVAYSNEEKTFAEKTQALGTDNASGFYLVANPYTCSISMAKFFEANTGLQKAIWMVENGEVKAISNAELDKQNYAIQPTQSFFVKKKEGKMVENVRFTSAMYVDRTITPGLLMASDYVKSVEATTENSSGQISKARIALRPEASADYDDQEDVDLLYDQNLKDVPQVYTVAGNEAVAVNAVPELSWIPLGIVSQQAEEVSLTLNGVNKLDAPVYLYDAASASFTDVHDGEAVKVKAGDHGRYFLTQTRTSTGIDRMEIEEQSAPVKVYSPAAGMIVVSALGGEKLDRVQVFTLDGKMVHSYQLPAKQRMILRVPSGIYIVKASTQSCAQAKGQKISVR